ncbi:MAG: GH25 family lysozyme [Lachnospiraceae bacterium]|nr:GH25 family lysozyme [Lachnospiraceae bacterium]
MKLNDDIDFVSTSDNHNSRRKSHKNKRKSRIRAMKIGSFIVGTILIAIIVIAFMVSSAKNKKSQLAAAEVESNQEQLVQNSDNEDGQTSIFENTDGMQVSANDIEKAINQNEIDTTAIGIDVAKYQGTIDWSQVAQSGINFAMIRVGYRTSKSGEIMEDATAKYNLQQAQANGIKLGAYFFSTAITCEEAKEEADWVTSYIAQYPITYPIAYNCEGFMDEENRNASLSNDERSKIAMAFLSEIENKDYIPMFYASKGELEENRYWNTDLISASYKIWVSQYPDVPYPEASSSDYTGKHDMWQYTSQGTIAGISKKVDVNVAYFGYREESVAKDSTAPEKVAANVEALMSFTDIDETITAKEKTNLRSEPSTVTGSVIASLNHGETVQRTGICKEAGWSRIIYNGQTLYAVNQYLTTDLNDDVAPVNDTETTSENTSENTSGTVDMVVDGLTVKTPFTSVNETVTAKEIVNLRSLPSVTNESVQILGTLSNGQTATRVGISESYGWSKLEYNGQIVYAVSSYLMVP